MSPWETQAIRTVAAVMRASAAELPADSAIGQEMAAPARRLLAAIGSDRPPGGRALTVVKAGV